MFESCRLRSRLRNCITIFSDGDVGNTGKHRFENKVFKINTVFQYKTDPPSMRMVSLWEIFIFGLQYSRIFLILNSFDFFLPSEDWFPSKI